MRDGYMKCIWIIENFTDSQDYRDLIEAVRASGRECHVIDKRNHFNFDEGWIKTGGCVLFQGSINMAKLAKESLSADCYPITYCDWNNFLCSNYYPHLKEFLFNDKYEIVPLKELIENKFDYYRKFGKEALIFVRPDSGEKTFQAQLIDLIDFDAFWQKGQAKEVKPEDLVLVSTPKKINGEWRFVCSKNEIIAQSTYQYQGQTCLIPCAPAGATALCEKILRAGYYPDEVFCVDICEDDDGHFWLLELTSFSSAGLYACDKQKIVEKVSEIAEKDYEFWAKMTEYLI